ncbi:MAG: glycyl-radical enzyme activating protein [Chloroflexi bacterium]|nr:glycyl-radical enzyme activating protein [Chloroflexota bacterium]
MLSESVRGIVFNIQDYCIHDGPGVRTTVFLKGCPLRCQWCSNPESIGAGRELGFVEDRCTKCGKCIPVCPEGVISAGDGGLVQVDRTKCTGCGKCVEVCPADALTVYGREMTSEELFEEVRKDEIFYRGSGGGVTVSGGEPLQQPELVLRLFQLCREAGIHTAIETTGHTSPATLNKVLGLTDYVLYDLKHLDSGVHQQKTGQPNKLILENARIVASSGKPFLFRMPLVPGVNDSAENIRATAEFIKGLRAGEARIELLPYHRLGSVKYKGLGSRYSLEGVPPPDARHVEEVVKLFEALGVACTVSR